MNPEQASDIGILPPNESPARIYGVVLGIGVFCSLAIVTTYEVTRPIIQRNKIEQRGQAIMDVIPKADSIASFRYESEIHRFVPADEKSEESLVFAGFSPSGELVGVVLSASGSGYQDTIQLLYGYEPSREEIVGIRILESRETPGLGDRIESDAKFLANFAHLDVRVTPEGDELIHPIEFAKAGDKSAAWQIDGITGATISSRAVAQMIQQSAAIWIPKFVLRRTDFVMPSSRRER